jgi:arsenate reductase-like glutaredoxin family protein
MAVQIFGTRKCPATRKAERFFKDRCLAYQFIDLAEKGPSPGELSSIKAAAGADTLIDLEGARAKKRGLVWLDYDVEEEILADPLLLRTPIVRDGRKAVVGDAPDKWAAFLP